MGSKNYTRVGLLSVVIAAMTIFSPSILAVPPCAGGINNDGSTAGWILVSPASGLFFTGDTVILTGEVSDYDTGQGGSDVSLVWSMNFDAEYESEEDPGTCNAVKQGYRYGTLTITFTSSGLNNVVTLTASQNDQSSMEWGPDMAQYRSSSESFIVIDPTAVSGSDKIEDGNTPGTNTPTSNSDPKEKTGEEENNKDDNEAEGGDPVTLQTGDHDYHYRDLFIPGRVMNVSIERRHRGQSEYNSAFGYGWDMNYNLKVRRLSDDPDSVYLLSGKNNKLEYVKDDTDPNLFIRSADPEDYLDYNSVSDTFTLVKKYGKRLEFDSNGNLSTIIDRNNNAITFEYDPNGLMPIYGPSDFFLEGKYGGPSDGRGIVAMAYRLTKITDDLNRDIDLAYDANGLLSTITDFAGRTWDYTYDSVSNDLHTITGPATTDYPSGLTTTYAYDDNHNMVSITDANSQTWLVNYYDSNEMVEEQRYGDANYVFVYNPDSNEATVTDRRGYDSNTIYNDAGNIVSKTVYTTGLRASDPAYYTTSYEYDSQGHITKKTFPAGNWIDYTYDPNGNLLTMCKEPNDGEPNIITSFTYDPNFDFVETITNPRGYVTAFDYNGLNGNLESITYPTVYTGDYGDVNSVVSFTYNSYGQVETVTAPDGMVTKYEYGTVTDSNNYGRLIKVIADYNTVDGLNIAYEYEYDIYGNIIEANDPNGNKYTSVYDELGLLIQTIDPLNNETNLWYNENKQLSQTINVVGDANQVTYYSYNILDKLQTINDPLCNTTTMSYDNSDNLSDVNDAEENNTYYDYDERNLPWKVTDANGNITEYSYTANGKLADINDPNDNITSYSYDGFDRLTCITYPDDTNEVFGYDDASNLTSFKTRKDETIYYEYDALNRITVKNRPDDPNIYFVYDIAGRLYDVNDGRAVSDGGGITSFTYDRIGRATEVNDIESRLVKYEYDERSLRTKLTYPDDSNVTYEYDSLSRLTKMKYEGSAVAEYSYDEISRRTLLALGNDANAVYEYDLANRLLKLTNNIDDSNTIIFDYNDYDKVGNRLRCKIDDSNAHQYTYDEIYRLTFVDYNDGNSTSYTYDSLGNRTEVDDGSSTSYLHNSLNQYTSVGGTSYTYDDNGNLTDDGTYKYYYDCENRLTDVNNQSDVAVASYKYDYQGRRISKTVSGTTTKYCYDGVQVIAEYENDTLVRKFIYGPGIDEPIYMITVSGGEIKYYYHFDGLGSVVALTDSTGDIVEKYSYDVFGEPNRTSSIGNPYFFTGRRLDTETDNYYSRARYYHPEIGRFLQRDPIFALNLYAYCLNNPINWVDPLGLSPIYEMEKIEFVDRMASGRWRSVAEHLPDLSEIYDSALSEERAYFEGIGIGDPYDGGFRHCLSAAWLSRKYDPVIARAFVFAWDIKAEWSDPDDKRDKYTDMAAEQIGLRKALEEPYKTCIEIAREAYPRDLDLLKHYHPELKSKSEKGKEEDE